MVKLRHINGNNLNELERQLEQIKLPINNIQVHTRGNEWYITFLVQGVHEEKQSVKKSVTKKTKTLTRK